MFIHFRYGGHEPSTTLAGPCKVLYYSFRTW